MKPAGIGARVAAAVVRAVGRMPRPVQRALAGRPRRVDGQALEPEMQLMLRLMALAPTRSFDELSVPEARREAELEAAVFGARRGIGMRAVEDLRLPGPAGSIAARLYIPHGVGDRSPLAVWFHGGGFVIGGHGTHDLPCRFLAHHAAVRVLSVAYRLAPEHRFPAAVEDAVAALEFAAAETGGLGADRTRIGVAGDSAGGNLAAGVAVRARDGGPRLAFQLLLFPWLDLSRKARSYELFRDGYFLTEAQLDWYRAHYLGTPRTSEWSSDDADAASDWRASPLLAPDLSGLPPAHVAVAGFDPLRDEGLAYARRLRQAGVPVTLRIHEGLTHSFINAAAVGRACAAASREVAAALRAGLYRG